MLESENFEFFFFANSAKEKGIGGSENSRKNSLSHRRGDAFVCQGKPSVRIARLLKIYLPY